jgi:hypothetical protein
MALTWSEYVDLVHPRGTVTSQWSRQRPINETLSPDRGVLFDADLVDYIKKNGIDYQTLADAPQARSDYEKPHQNIVQAIADIARTDYDSTKPFLRTTPEQVDEILNSLPNLSGNGKQQAVTLAFNSTGFDPARHLEKLTSYDSDFYNISPLSLIHI